MAYPFLPVNPCCTDVVINDVCGCSSTITNTGCVTNNPCSTTLTASNTIIYNGPALPCTLAEPCDTLNVVLQKIDQVICNLLTQINTLTNQVNNITSQVLNINTNIVSLANDVDACCPTTTTTTTTCDPLSVHPYSNRLIFGTTDTPSTLTSLISACAAASCLQATTCTITSGALVYFDVEFPTIGDRGYGSDLGCSIGLAQDGYYVFENPGSYTVVQVINSVIVGTPTC